MNKIITINNIPEIIKWNNMQFQLDDKTILHYIDIIDWHDDDTPKMFELNVNFFDYYYTVNIYYEDILSNFNYCYAEGPSILFASLEDWINNEHWELICKLINKMANEIINE